MQNIESSQDYDNYLKKYIHKYVVTKFLGRGQYEKTWFFSLEEAQRFHRIMKKIDATWESIEHLMKKIKVNCSDAKQYADDAVDNAEYAYKNLTDLQELLRLRKEYDDQPSNREELMSCVDSMQDSISDLADNIIKIKKGR